MLLNRHSYLQCTYLFTNSCRGMCFQKWFHQHFTYLFTFLEFTDLQIRVMTCIRLLCLNRYIDKLMIAIIVTDGSSD